MLTFNRSTSVAALVASAEDGAEAARLTLTSDLPLGPAAALSGAALAALSSDGAALCGARLAAGGSELRCVKLAQLLKAGGGTGGGGGAKLSPAGEGSVFVAVAGAGGAGR